MCSRTHKVHDSERLLAPFVVNTVVDRKAAGDTEPCTTYACATHKMSL